MCVFVKRYLNTFLILTNIYSIPFIVCVFLCIVYHASVYLMSHSWSAGKHSLRPSNVRALRLVLFKFSFLSCFIAFFIKKKNKKINHGIMAKKNLQARQARPLSVTGVSHRLSTCNRCKCSLISSRPWSPNFVDHKLR